MGNSREPLHRRNLSQARRNLPCMALKNRVTRYFEIKKFTKAEDGTLMVDGVASTGNRDDDGEIITSEAMKAALPDFMKWANLREMHQPIAAGAIKAMSVDTDGKTQITAHVVDAGSVLKVETGVLKGFSVRGSISRNANDKTIIEAIKLSEVSLVDRPANPECTITVVKMKQGGLDEVVKGLYTVGSFAQTIQDLDYLAQSTQYEADYEGDGSTIPAQIKALVSSACGILRALVAEETAELTGEAMAPEDATKALTVPGALKRSEKFLSVAKALVAGIKGDVAEKKGAKFSAKTKDDLKKIHGQIDDCSKALADCSKAMGATGYADADDPEGQKALVAGEVQKVSAERDELKQKLDEVEKRAKEATARVTEMEQVCGEADEAIKAAIAREGALSKDLDAAKDALKVELARKGSLRVVAVEKSKDGVSTGGKSADDKTAAATEPEPLEVMKSAQKTPFRPAVGGFGVVG